MLDKDIMENEMRGKVKTIDIESSDLLEAMLDHTSFPYKLKNSAKLHVVVIRDCYTDEVFKAEGAEITKEWMQKNLDGCEILCGHNSTKFDYPALMLFGVFDYYIGYLDETDTLFGKPVQFVDTLIWSRLFNPDRYLGHSLASWGERTGVAKMDFRGELIEKGLLEKGAPKGEEFRNFTPLMGTYCELDTLVSKNTYFALKAEYDEYSGWQQASKMEHKLADLAVRRESLGFWFDKDLAIECLDDLGKKMEDLQNKVNPILPPKPMTKGELAEFTPPKTQLNKKGEPSHYIIKFADRLGGTIEKWENGDDHVGYVLNYEGKRHKLPHTEPLRTHTEADISNLDHVKTTLIDDYGWVPIEWAERDFTKDAKKQTLTYEKRVIAFERWLKETVEGKYKKLRLKTAFENFKCKNVDSLEEIIKEKLRQDFPVRLPTSPKIRVGVEKDLCPNLIKLGDKVSFAKDFALYLTYKHRRSSIAGGDIEDMDFHEEAPNTGFLSMYREEDSRVICPAIEIGSATNRYRHIGIANIARASSIYGKEMRSLFGCGEGFMQLGFDFSSLENRVQGGYVKKYPHGEELAEMLLADKPNDLHSVNSRKLGISRTDAKSFGYACLPEDITEVLTEKGWKFYKDLEEGDGVLSYNTEKDIIESDIIHKLHYFTDKKIVKISNSRDVFESTEDHRWYGKRRTGHGRKNPKYYVNEFFTTKDIKTENNILMSAKYPKQESNMTVAEARMLGWILADGSYTWSKYNRNRLKGLNVNVFQSKNKFYKELEKDMTDAGYHYTIHEKKVENKNNVYCYHIKTSCIRPLFEKLKLPQISKHEVDWVSIVLGMSEECRDNFVHTFYLADGHYNNNITQNYGNIHEGITLAFYLQGNRIGIQKKTEKCSVIIKHSGRYLTGQKLVKEELPARPTFCLTTRNSTFIIRQNKFMSITGNCLYGAAPKKLSKMLNVPIEKGKELFDGFWEAVPALKMLRDNLIKHWESNDKKWVRAIDGRKIFIRSPHSCINFLFQSGGVICAKYTLVYLMQILEKQGYNIDCFKGTPDIAEMISYHDECQLLLKKDLVKFQLFDSEKEAEEFKNTWAGEGKLSGIKEGKNNKWYIALPNPLSQAIQEATEKVEKLLSLHFNLAFEYDVHKNWYGCH